MKPRPPKVSHQSFQLHFRRWKSRSACAFDLPNWKEVKREELPKNKIILVIFPAKDLNLQPVSKARRVISKQKATTLSIPTVPKASAQANGPADFVTELKYRAGGQRGERCGNYVLVTTKSETGFFCAFTSWPSNVEEFIEENYTNLTPALVFIVTSSIPS